MNHIQGVADWKPTKAAPAIQVVVLAHGNDGQSSVLFPHGSIQRVSTKRLKMKIEQFELPLPKA